MEDFDFSSGDTLALEEATAERFVTDNFQQYSGPAPAGFENYAAQGGPTQGWDWENYVVQGGPTQGWDWESYGTIVPDSQLYGMGAYTPPFSPNTVKYVLGGAAALVLGAGAFYLMNKRRAVRMNPLGEPITIAAGLLAAGTAVTGLVSSIWGASAQKDAAKQALQIEQSKAAAMQKLQEASIAATQEAAYQSQLQDAAAKARSGQTMLMGAAGIGALALAGLLVYRATKKS